MDLPDEGAEDDMFVIEDAVVSGNKGASASVHDPAFASAPVSVADAVHLDVPPADSMRLPSLNGFPLLLDSIARDKSTGGASVLPDFDMSLLWCGGDAGGRFPTDAFGNTSASGPPLQPQLQLQLHPGLPAHQVCGCVSFYSTKILADFLRKDVVPDGERRMHEIKIHCLYDSKCMTSCLRRVAGLPTLSPESMMCSLHDGCQQSVVFAVNPTELFEHKLEALRDAVQRVVNQEPSNIREKDGAFVIEYTVFCDMDK